MTLNFIGDIRPGAEFQFTAKPDYTAAATFIACDGDTVRVTRRATDLFGLDDATLVLANWHGEWRTDVFLLTVGELKAKAAAFER